MVKTSQRSDYTAPVFFMEEVQLTLDLSQQPVLSKAKLTMKRNQVHSGASTELILDGENMVLINVAINQQVLTPSEYQVTEQALIIKDPPLDIRFTVELTSQLGNNSDLFGLYETEGTFLVKAETEGLRRVFYCVDRPDNLASYTTTIIANKQDYPVLLSNGLLKEQQQLDKDKHLVSWSDPFPKPSYLFALVAGTLRRSATEFITRSKRVIPIVFYVPAAANEKCHFAKEVLKQVMQWDENNYRIECDLPQHMIAGVDKYASGASETTGLNLFNTENLYATPAIKNDLGILRVLEVIAHEYCHTLTGNRVTIANWFNLAWKEGLTTLRASLFCEDLLGSDLVKLLEGKNLDERAPMPDSYTAVRSLYTTAAYEKSAAIFRMIMTCLGKQKFNEGLTAFLLEHYGQAVTIEQFLEFLSEFSNSQINSQSFLLWFTEPGIPKLTVTEQYDLQNNKYTLTFTTENRKSRPIPVVIGLLDSLGNSILDDNLLMIEQDLQHFVFNNISAKPVPSLLRSFSAPVYLSYKYTIQELLLLIRYDSNMYNRCQAAKNLMTQLIQDYCQAGALHLSEEIYVTYRALFTDAQFNHWLLAEILTLPTEEELIAGEIHADFDKIAEARDWMLTSLAKALKPQLTKLFDTLQQQADVSNPQISFFDIKDAGKRRLLSVCWQFLITIEPKQIKDYLVQLFDDSLTTNMTNTTNALSTLCAFNCPEATTALAAFYDYWAHDTNAINYWFKIQAANHTSNVVEQVSNLLKDPAFDISNPNKVYALIGPFIKNPYGFHSASGNGYKLVADIILQLDKINPALGGRLTDAFMGWKKYDATRQQAMIEALERIKNESTSEDVRNKVMKLRKTEPRP